MLESELGALDAALPGTLPILPGLSMTGRYVLTNEAPSQRGDGLKAVALGDGRVALMVGDAVGHGAPASTAMARLLAIMRERLEDGSSAEEAIRFADRYAASASVATGATMAIALVSLDDGMVEYATAGHPAPLWTRADGSTHLLELPPSRPLGAGGRAAVIHGTLGIGELITLYTDGLLSSSGERMRTGQDQLRDVIERAVARQSTAQAHAAARGDDLCEAILTTLPSPHGHADDIALLVAERRQDPPAFSLTIDATQEEVRRVGHALETWLTGLGVGLLDHMALHHAYSEIATNAVKHAYRDHPDGALRPVHVEASLGDDGVLNLCIKDGGRWRANPRSETGRGLVVAGGLVDSMRLSRTRGGTEVLMRQELGRAIPVLRSAPSTSILRPTLAEEMVIETVAVDRLGVAGAVDERASEEFQVRVHEATQAGTSDTTIDLSGVTHLASPAIRTLFDYLDRSDSSGAVLTLIASDASPAHQVLDLVSLPHRSG